MDYGSYSANYGRTDYGDLYSYDPQIEQQTPSTILL